MKGVLAVSNAAVFELVSTCNATTGEVELYHGRLAMVGIVGRGDRHHVFCVC